MKALSWYDNVFERDYQYPPARHTHNMPHTLIVIKFQRDGMKLYTYMYGVPVNMSVKYFRD